MLNLTVVFFHLFEATSTPEKRAKRIAAWTPSPSHFKTKRIKPRTPTVKQQLFAKRDVGTQIPDVAHNVRRVLNDSDVVKVGHVYFL